MSTHNPAKTVNAHHVVRAVESRLRHVAWTKRECIQNFDGVFRKRHLEEDNIKIAVKNVELINKRLVLATVAYSGVPTLLT